jgi:hypothetical protein
MNDEHQPRRRFWEGRKTVRERWIMCHLQYCMLEQTVGISIQLYFSVQDSNVKDQANYSDVTGTAESC